MTSPIQQEILDHLLHNTPEGLKPLKTKHLWFSAEENSLLQKCICVCQAACAPWLEVMLEDALQFQRNSDLVFLIEDATTEDSAKILLTALAFGCTLSPVYQTNLAKRMLNKVYYNNKKLNKRTAAHLAILAKATALLTPGAMTAHDRIVLTPTRQDVLSLRPQDAMDRLHTYFDMVPT